MRRRLTKKPADLQRLPPIPGLAEIRRRAAALWVQYPEAPLDFIARSLEYETGVRVAVLSRALHDLAPGWDGDGCGPGQAD